MSMAPYPVKLSNKSLTGGTVMGIGDVQRQRHRELSVAKKSGMLWAKSVSLSEIHRQ